MEISLEVKKYKQEGNLAHEYNPLRNMMLEDGSITDFNTDELKIDLNNPVNIECQPSYDGTVNLILNDDKNPPRIINTRFTKLEDNRYKVINRNQIQQTNLYRVGMIDQQTRLFRNINKIPKIDLVNIGYFGQLKGGNYTFYVKFADNDYNKTDVVAESGVVSVFKGTWTDPRSVSGTLQDERTDKSITLNVSNIDASFASMYVYYVRQYSDTNGTSMEEAGMFKEPFPIKNNSELITLNGFEEVEPINVEDLNIKYNLVTNVKTQAQVQNMLFFGNVEGVNVDLKTLQNISYFVQVELCQSDDSLGWLDEQYRQKSKDDLSKAEYYNPNYLYYNLGYWPDEIYRLGIVYIMNDDSLSPVFNLRGHNFERWDQDDNFNFVFSKDIKNPVCWSDEENGGERNEQWIKDYAQNKTNVYKYETYQDIYNDQGMSIGRKPSGKLEMNWIPKNDYIEDQKYLDNTFGVFKNPSIDSEHQIIKYGEKNTPGEVKPWYYKFHLNEYLLEDLKKMGVKGFFIVRQKRIPTTLCQGLTCAIDRISYTPMLSEDGGKNNWFSESFLSNSRLLTTDFASHRVSTEYKQSAGIYSLDPAVTPLLQSTFDGSEFILKYIQTKGKLTPSRDTNRHFYFHSPTTSNTTIRGNCVFVDEDVPIKFMDNYGFSSRAGTQEDVKQFAFFSEKDYKGTARNLLRGIWGPYIGTNTNMPSNTIVDIKIGNYSELFLKDYFDIRGKDNSEFFAISDRIQLSDYYKVSQDQQTREVKKEWTPCTLDVYRGDCYVANVTLRINRNFTDSEVPVNDVIIDNDTWSKNYKGYMGETEAEDWLNINKADINTVPLGMWLTFKCLSNYNLNLRSEDRQNTDEIALMGNPRSFYPLSDASTAVSYKVPESKLQNSGYNTTVGKKRNLIAPNVPYINDLYDNRIMFSNVQVDDDFKNAYRIFQGLSYEDIDRQYGAIVKLIPWGVNLLCVFEHGCAMVPINEKALMTTTTGQSIHLYGADVLQKQVTLISPDFGSIWQDSIIRTPLGVYGVDTYAKKIWRFTDSKGFETISDMKIQRFLNDHIKLEELDKYPTIGLRNVKSHYNNYKGDVMFTFYNFTYGEEWNFCFNERMDKWITRYSWTPLYSENINNIFYSLDKKRVEVLSYIYDNRHASVGINTSENQWKYTRTNDKPIYDDGRTTDFQSVITIKGYDLAAYCQVLVKKVSTSYINEDGEEIEVELPIDCVTINSKFNAKSSKDIKYSNILVINKSKIQDLIPIGEPLYYLIDVETIPYLSYEYDSNGKIIGYDKTNKGKPFKDKIGIVVETEPDSKEAELYDKLLVNGFYVHGRAGIFDEMNYVDPEAKNRIFPTKWYDKQEPFEFEFVVNGEQVGMHKIFNDLIIISNNVEPEEFEFSIVGDVYNFPKDLVYKTQNDPDYKGDPFFRNATVAWDPILNEYMITTKQQAKNLKTYGRRLGNIQYKEDSWYTNIEPIKYWDMKGNIQQWSSTRIRDKYIKIRVKYKGDKLAVITSLKTLYSLSFS